MNTNTDNKNNGRHKFLASRYRLLTILLLTAGCLLLTSPARADFDYADSPEFAIDLLSFPLGGAYDYADSSGFSLDLYPVNRGWGDSGSFSFDGGQPWQTADFAGVVRDKRTGTPIKGATVTLSGETPVQTDDQGQFSIDDPAGGEKTLTVSKSGYYPVDQTVTVTEGSGTFINILMNPEVDFGVAQVRSKYCQGGKDVYFLDGVSLSQTFTATIDWHGHTPYQVKWILPGQTITDSISGDTISRSFDVGNDFEEGETLRVVAVADGGALESMVYAASFLVIPVPPIVNLIPSAYYVPMNTATGLQYKILGIDSLNMSVAQWDEHNVPSSFPLFGGKSMKVGFELSGQLSGNISGDGKAELFAFGYDKKYKQIIRKGIKPTKGMKLPFIEFSPGIALEFNFVWSAYQQKWMPGGGLDLGCDFLYSSPQIPCGAVGPVPIYVRAEVSLDLDLEVGIDDWDSQGPLWTGTFEFEPLAKGILGAGVAKVVCVEGYLGGGFHGEFEFMPTFDWMDPYIILVGGVQAVTGPFKWGPLELRYEWPEQEAGAMSSMLSMDELLRGDDYSLLSRDYLSYQSQAAQPLLMMDEGMALLGEGGLQGEQVLQSAVYPYSVPDTAVDSYGIVSAWIADDTGRSLINRTEATFAGFDNGIWSEPNAIFDDGTADLYPQLLSLSETEIACIWQNANDVLPDTADMETFLSNLEIAVSVYDSGTGNWSAVQRITSNNILDRSARLAASDPCDMLAVWVSNATNDLWGSTTNTNNIMWSHCDGVNWNTPAAMAAGFGTILDTTLAYDGVTGTFVFCVDADDDLDTSEDQDLWVSTYSGVSWTTPAQLTSDPNTDTAPRLAYDSGGTLYLAWLQGSDIRMAVGTDVGNSVVVATPNESIGSKDFDLVMGDNGQVALIWNDVSETYNDLWVAYYSQTLDIWSQPRQLTRDDAAERFVSGQFAPNGSLFCLYDKNWTEYEDQEVIIDGNPVIVEGVPKAGRSDLTCLVYELSSDLSITVEDVDMDPLNPTPGSQATLTATVSNLGESAATDVDVAFYDGDPQAAGTLIESVQTIVDPIAGGQQAQVSVLWTVPSTILPRDIYVVVDPDLEQDDRDWLNNIAQIQVLRADITISEIVVQRAGGLCVLTARIANEGVLDASNINVKLRLNASDGTILAQENVPLIAAGAYQDVSFVVTSLPYGLPILYTTVDENNSIDEFDEDNNIQSTIAVNPVPGDFQPDGVVDTEDLFELSSHWLATGSHVPGDIYPAGGDGIVNLMDFAEMASFWLLGVE